MSWLGKVLTYKIIKYLKAIIYDGFFNSETFVLSKINNKETILNKMLDLLYKLCKIYT